MQCPNCEVQNKEGAQFCESCGFPLSGAIAQTARSIAGSATITRSFRIDEDEEPAPVEAEPVSEIADGGDTSEAAPAGDDSLASETAESLEDDSNHEGGVSDGPRAEEELAESVAMPETTLASAEDIYNSGNVFGDAAKTLKMPYVIGQKEKPAAPVAPAAPAPEQAHDEEQAAAEPQPDYPETGNDLPGFAPPPVPVSPPEPNTPASAAGSQSQGDWVSDGVEEGPDVTKQMPRVESDEPVVNRDYLASATKTRKKGNGGKIAAIIALVVVAVAAVVFATYQFGLWGGKVVPNVVGMTENDAKTVLVDSGFKPKAMQVKSDDTEGLVLLMDPNANSRAEEGSEVVIHIATARLIPEIVGKPLADAQALLNEAGYENIKLVPQKSNDEENIVLAVTPEPGVRTKSSMEVTVTVSEAYRVPDISGMTLEQARQAVVDAGLTVQAVYVDRTDVPEGTLTGTEPAAGEKVSEGDLVTIGIARSRGAELESLTQDYVSPGSTITLRGVQYDIVSLKSVYYEGENTVAFTATARPKISFFGETLYTSGTQTIEGEVVWSESNKVIAIYG